METLFTAASPPKWRVAPAAESRASAMLRLRHHGLLDSAGLETIGEAREAAGEEQYHQYDQAAHQQLPVLGESRKIFLHHHECKRAGNGAVQRAHAAQDHHQQHVAGLVPAQDFRVDEAELARGEITREAAETAGDREAR